MSIERVKMKYEEELLQLPNVTGIGIGEKAGKKVIKILVTHKLPESALRPRDIIPKMLDGYKTDVYEIGVVRMQTLNNQ
ncbi:hypothetical protein SAMN05660649_02090 [Desulfotomaculum arcticum]|uniref:Uncharacterized protein n=1 Tax=Desulfotruncus arcticus DSM 17038 TaxID=1121424 RepID=A0A1I2T4T9_9FIRM|nr:hypothetical protein [Desulfotruncus arcticus]SFG58197.1 hypothetical protein SAMN05660649_02090 [Desulfotomaculum arcticum] [Desulfotruncus arcticus DSM 17038]